VFEKGEEEGTGEGRGVEAMCLPIKGASYSPSASSSQSAGFWNLGSGTSNGKSSRQSSGFFSLGSITVGGSFSSQSSGFLASGSLILFSKSVKGVYKGEGESVQVSEHRQPYLASFTQSAGISSTGSSMVAGGFTAGVKSSNKEPYLLINKYKHRTQCICSNQDHANSE
jgi:hypothetical protein